ncbi:hypothetical protein ACQP2C_27320 [Micromonospora zamorensis]
MNVQIPSGRTNKRSPACRAAHHAGTRRPGTTDLVDDFVAAANNASG